MGKYKKKIIPQNVRVCLYIHDLNSLALDKPFLFFKPVGLGHKITETGFLLSNRNYQGQETPMLFRYVVVKGRRKYSLIDPEVSQNNTLALLVEFTSDFVTVFEKDELVNNYDDIISYAVYNVGWKENSVKVKYLDPDKHPVLLSISELSELEY